MPVTEAGATSSFLAISAVVARPSSPALPLRGPLSAWRQVHSLDVPGGPIDHASYPGVFAKGGLDAASVVRTTNVGP